MTSRMARIQLSIRLSCRATVSSDHSQFRAARGAIVWVALGRTFAILLAFSDACEAYRNAVTQDCAKII